MILLSANPARKSVMISAVDIRAVHIAKPAAYGKVVKCTHGIHAEERSDASHCDQRIGALPPRSRQAVGEPLARYGPIAMSSQVELKIASEDYRRGIFVK